MAHSSPTCGSHPPPRAEEIRHVPDGDSNHLPFERVSDAFTAQARRAGDHSIIPFVLSVDRHG